MLEALLPMLACPDCRGDLDMADNGKSLQCEICKAVFAIHDGVLCLMPSPDEESSDSEAKERERNARDEQAGDYDKMVGLKLFGIAELPLTLRMMSRQRSDVLAEIGCGTGRMTPTFAKRANQVLALDFSLESLKRCKAKLDMAKVTNVLLIQGDATCLPFKDGIANQVVSCQVLEHVPSYSGRTSMVRELRRIAVDGASIVLSAYKHSLLTKMFAKKEGEHEGGIYYYRFARQELRDLIEKQLNVRSMTGVMVYHYLVSAQKN